MLLKTPEDSLFLLTIASFVPFVHLSRYFFHLLWSNQGCNGDGDGDRDDQRGCGRRLDGEKVKNRGTGKIFQNFARDFFLHKFTKYEHDSWMTRHHDGEKSKAGVGESTGMRKNRKNGMWTGMRMWIPVPVTALEIILFIFWSFVKKQL